MNKRNLLIAKLKAKQKIRKVKQHLMEKNANRTPTPATPATPPDQPVGYGINNGPA